MRMRRTAGQPGQPGQQDRGSRTRLPAILVRVCVTSYIVLDSMRWQLYLATRHALPRPLRLLRLLLLLLLLLLLPLLPLP